VASSILVGVLDPGRNRRGRSVSRSDTLGSRIGRLAGSRRSSRSARSMN